MKTKTMIRFEIRLSQEQKEYLEYASRLGGYKSLSEFILSSSKNAADQVVERHQQILASAQDREIFFAALVSLRKPNSRLKVAVDRYNNQVKKR